MCNFSAIFPLISNESCVAIIHWNFLVETILLNGHSILIDLNKEVGIWKNTQPNGISTTDPKLHKLL